MSSKQDGGVKVIAYNRKARHNYHILETIEAGLSLTGEEIKSIRAGEVTIAESYVRNINGELFLINAHINKYSQSGNLEYDPTRQRKLLVQRRQIDKLIHQLESKGLTIVPLDIHLKNGRAKLEIALAKGKSAPDKRASIKEREGKREVARELRRG